MEIFIFEENYPVRNLCFKIDGIVWKFKGPPRGIVEEVLL